MNKIISKLRELLEKIKIFLSKKKNLVTVLIILGIILITIIILVLSKNKKNQFTLNEIYNVYPEEVRTLYSNIVSVSCYGDLYLNIGKDSGSVKTDDMNDNNLIDYMFSNLDKNNQLTDEFELKVINITAKSLFNTTKELSSKITNYQYGNYIYNIKDSKVTRTKSECHSDREYVSQLYGYSYNKNQLSMDVNIGYLKDGILYDLDNNRLGSYNRDVKELANLFVGNSYYRFNYVLDGKNYKLDNVEWNSKL